MSTPDLGAIRRRLEVARGLLRSITPWPWEVVRVESSDFPCVPHPHWDFYHNYIDMGTIEPGGKAVGGTERQVNIGCFLGKECDADFIHVAPAFIRQQRDDLAALCDRVAELEAALRAILGMDPEQGTYSEDFRWNVHEVARAALAADPLTEGE